MKQQIIAEHECTIPKYLMSALINADVSGLEDGDIADLEKLEKELNALVKKHRGCHYTVDYGDCYFLYTNDDDLCCNVVDCTVHIFAETHDLIIDMYTSDVKRVMRRLECLVSTVECESYGMYTQDNNYSQVHLLTLKTANETEKWLWKNNFNYVGVTQNNRM